MTEQRGWLPKCWGFWLKALWMWMISFQISLQPFCWGSWGQNQDKIKLMRRLKRRESGTRVTVCVGKTNLNPDLMNRKGREEKTVERWLFMSSRCPWTWRSKLFFSLPWAHFQSWLPVFRAYSVSNVKLTSQPNQPQLDQIGWIYDDLNITANSGFPYFRPRIVVVVEVPESRDAMLSQIGLDCQASSMVDIWSFTTLHLAILSTALIQQPHTAFKMSMFRSKKMDLGCFLNIKVIRDHTKRKVFAGHETERYGMTIFA